MSKKEFIAEKARAKYSTNKDSEQRRKFIFRIMNGNIPNLSSMTKYGYTLETINEVRKGKQLPPITNSDIRGLFKKKMEMAITSEDEVLKSVIPNVHMFKDKTTTKEPVRVIDINDKSIITLDVYLECLSHKLSSKSIANYRRYLKIILKALNYKDGDSIVDYLKDYTNVSNVIDNLKQTRGKDKGNVYAQSTLKLFYQSISTGFYNNSCPPFEKQMGAEAKKFYSMKIDTMTFDDKNTRMDRTKNSKYKDWNDIVKITEEYNKNKKNSLENRTLTQIYTLLGGMPRTSSFLKLHVVDNINDTTNINKNYYNTKDKIIISNTHKTGVNEKKRGKPIIVNLKLSKYDKEIHKNLDKLAETSDLLFNKQQSHMSTFFKKVYGVTVTHMRHSNETYNKASGNIDTIFDGLAINAHSYGTANNFYVGENSVPTTAPTPARRPAAKSVRRPVVKSTSVRTPVPAPSPVPVNVRRSTRNRN